MRLRCIAVVFLLSSLPFAVLPSPIVASTIPGNAAQTSTAAVPGVWIDVPFSPQTKDGCGSASISMVMRYWDHKMNLPVAADADAGRIQSALFSPRAGGIFSSSMQKYFRKSGYQAFAFQGQWSDLEHHLALGRPLIAGIQPNGRLGPLHYVVVVGIEPQRGYVLVNDPAQQKMLRISREGFESEWRPTHNWTLLAVPQTAH